MRIIKGISLLLCFMFFIGGCSHQVIVEDEKKENRERLVLWSYYEAESQKEALNKLISDFNKSQYEYEALWEYVPMTEFTKRLAIGLTEEQLPDLVIIDNPDMNTYVNLGMFEDISVYINNWDNEEEYYKEVWKSIKSKDSYYGIPFCTNNLALIYNKDMLEEKGIGKITDWDEFLDAAKRLTSRNVYGFAMSAVEGEQCTFQTLPWILSEGGSVDILEKEKILRAYTKINTLIQNGSMDRNCVNWSQIDIARKFIAGEAAMMENGPWVLSMLKEAGVSYGIARLPFEDDNKVIIGGENLGVIKGQNVEGSIAFLEYYNQDQVMQEICKIANALPPKIRLTEELKAENPELEVFARQMDSAVSRASFENWSQISKAISAASHQIFIGEKTPEEAAEDLEQQLQK